MNPVPEEIEWHPDGEDVPAWFFGALIVGCGLIVLAVVVALAPLDVEPARSAPATIPAPSWAGGAR